MQVGIDVHDEWAAWFNLRWVVEGVEDFNGDGHADVIEFRDMDWRRFNDIRFGARPGNSLSICGFTPADRARSLGDIDGDLAGEFACVTDGETRLDRFHSSMVIPVAVPRCDAVGAEPLGVDLAYRGVSAVDANGDRFVVVAARARMTDGSERDVVWFGGVGGLRGDRCALRGRDHPTGARRRRPRAPYDPRGATRVIPGAHDPPRRAHALRVRRSLRDREPRASAGRDRLRPAARRPPRPNRVPSRP